MSKMSHDIFKEQRIVIKFLVKSGKNRCRNQAFVKQHVQWSHYEKISWWLDSTFLKWLRCDRQARAWPKHWNSNNLSWSSCSTRTTVCPSEMSLTSCWLTVKPFIQLWRTNCVCKSFVPNLIWRILPRNRRNLELMFAMISLKQLSQKTFSNMW